MEYIQILQVTGALLLSFAVAGSLSALKQSLKQYSRRQRQY